MLCVEVGNLQTKLDDGIDSNYDDAGSIMLSVLIRSNSVQVLVFENIGNAVGLKKGGGEELADHVTISVEVNFA